MENENLEFLDERTRHISLMIYGDEKCVIKSLEDQKSKIRAYAYILHDKDVNKDGELKEAHWHCNITLFNATTPRAAIKWFKRNTEQNVFAEPIQSVLKAFEYLTHKNDQSKYQYSEDEVKLGNTEFWCKIFDDEVDEENIGLQIIDDLTAGTSYYEMCKRYGREWIIYHERYELMYRKIRDNWRP